MAANDPRTQEQSIKSRKQELFGSDERAVLPGGPRRSFQDCLKATPATPLSTPIKALLWTVGTIVILIFIAALLKGGGSKPKARGVSAVLVISSPRPAV